MTIAVTGPYASGKSTFVEILGSLGAETVSADEIVHELLAGDAEAISRIRQRFGEGVLGDEGVDRRALGRRVFADREALEDLEEILHPLVRRETDRRIEGSDADVFVAEIPLLFEGGHSETFDYTVAVIAPEERRREWARRRGVEEEARRAIEARQLRGEEKAHLADVVVENDGGPGRLRELAEDLLVAAARERRPGARVQDQEA